MAKKVKRGKKLPNAEDRALGTGKAKVRKSKRR